MIAVDTNVLVRVLLNDDPGQGMIAMDLLAQEQLFVAITVWLELEWVLRSYGRRDRQQVNAALRLLSAHPNIFTSRPDLLAWALERHAAGGDLADMLHMTLGIETTMFASFDRHVASDAGPDAPVPVRTL